MANFAFAGLKRVSANIANTVTNTKVFDQFVHELKTGAKGDKALVKEIILNKGYVDKNGKFKKPTHKYTIKAVFLYKLHDKEGNAILDKNEEVVTKVTYHKILTNTLEDGLTEGTYIEWRPVLDKDGKPILDKENKPVMSYQSVFTDKAFVTVQVVTCAKPFPGKPWTSTKEKEYIDEDGTVYSHVMNTFQDKVYPQSSCVFGAAYELAAE